MCRLSALLDLASPLLGNPSTLSLEQLVPSVQCLLSAVTDNTDADAQLLSSLLQASLQKQVLALVYLQTTDKYLPTVLENLEYLSVPALQAVPLVDDPDGLVKKAILGHSYLVGPKSEFQAGSWELLQLLLPKDCPEVAQKCLDRALEFPSDLQVLVPLVLQQTPVTLEQLASSQALQQQWNAENILIVTSVVCASISETTSTDYLPLIQACLDSSEPLVLRRGLWLLERVDQEWTQEYTTLFQVVAMETEVHLVAQIWSRLQACTVPDPAYLRYIWKALLQSMSSPHLRKVSLVAWLDQADALECNDFWHMVMPAYDQLGPPPIVIHQDDTPIHITKRLLEFASKIIQAHGVKPLLQNPPWSVPTLVALYQTAATTVASCTNLVLTCPPQLNDLPWVELQAQGCKHGLLESLSVLLAHLSIQRTPTQLLELLDLFGLPHNRKELHESKTYQNLRRFCRDRIVTPPNMELIAYVATIVTGYVDGMVPERLGHAAALLVTLGCNEPSSVLWPALQKGLKHHASRTLSLWEAACRLQLVTGLGNGDVVVDGQEQYLPPPPVIDAVLVQGVHALRSQVSELYTESSDDESVRSSAARQLSDALAVSIRQAQALVQGYPSSSTLTECFQEVVDEQWKIVHDATQKDRVATALNVLYLGLAGASSSGQANHCRKLMKLRFYMSNVSKSIKTAARSLFEVARWGCLGYWVDASDASLRQELFDYAKDQVEAMPPAAMPLVFDCLISMAGDETGEIMDTLLTVAQDTTSARESLLRMDQVSQLIFQNSLMVSEAKRFAENSQVADLPIRAAFRTMIQFAGNVRSQVLRSVVSRAMAGWLGPNDDDAGMAALPYLDDLLELLLFKEKQLDPSAANQAQVDLEALSLPELQDRSIARGVVLVFISRLPSLEQVHPDVLLKLIHPMMKSLLKSVSKRTGEIAVMVGSESYCRKIRGWQALCILSRFVTKDMVESLCEVVFAAIAEPLHGQIRYFMEVFCIQMTRRFPQVLGMLKSQLELTDLSIQQISSLMIISGSIVVGRYQQEFLEGSDKKDLHEILVAVIPWLGSTQGFSRAIAQILVHKMIPLVMDMNDDKSSHDNHWYLIRLFQFLDSNKEMMRLRAKQAKFFEEYDVDEACTVEAMFRLPVDESGEVFPVHLVESMKKTLQELYAEAHEDEVPHWRQEEVASSKVKPLVSTAPSTDTESNFQRKILPLDALNLALKESEEKKNLANYKKQDIIVCASLVDKVPNLGGLARTSEIFAVDRLVIPDLKVTKMDNFVSLSASANEWIDIEECREAVSWC